MEVERERDSGTFIGRSHQISLDYVKLFEMSTTYIIYHNIWLSIPFCYLLIPSFIGYVCGLTLSIKYGPQVWEADRYT